jgi:pimeloyl-ACP methyl ester carboxylesterase
MNAAGSFESRYVETEKVRLFCEAFGTPGDPFLLLIMGNSAPGLVWPDAFCTALAERGFYVVRFDQRDTGLSIFIDFDAAPYSLDTLAADAFAVLDAFGARKAHIVGLSQGGGLAYRMALVAPERVIDVVAVMTSPDLEPKNRAFAGLPPPDGELPRPGPDYVAAVIALNSVAPTDEQGLADQFVENFRLAKGPRSPFDETAWATLGRKVARQTMARTDGLTAKIANNSNHTRAQKATPSLTKEDLARITVPVLIVHGGGDPIFPVEHALWSRAAIPGAELRVLDDMGHALDPAFFGAIIDLIAAFCDRPSAG